MVGQSKFANVEEKYAAQRRYNHKALKRRQSLPRNYTKKDWRYAVDYFGNRCAVCGRKRVHWRDYQLVQDHWIPVSDPLCPGTIPTNIVPLCHGPHGCNNQKHTKRPEEWIVKRLGKRNGLMKLAEINAYFASLTRAVPSADAAPGDDQ